MRLQSLLFAVAWLSLLGACSSSTKARAEPVPQRSRADAVATEARHIVADEARHGVVLELFTSEGCSSCPPADRLLAQIVADAKRERAPVYALSFHVDYWDHLGWKDAFSKPQYSERQSWYSSRVEGGVYTPELVVAGQEAFVGSNRTRAHAAIERALESPWTAAVSLTFDAQGRLAYRVSDVPPSAHLNLALVQPRARSQVASGENAGSTLTHVNVVRDFTRVDLKDPSGFWTPRIPRDAAEPAVVAYVQDDRTAAIVAAASAAVPLKTPSAGL